MRQSTLVATPTQVDQAHAILEMQARRELQIVGQGSARPVPPELAELLTTVLESLVRGGSLAIETMPTQLTTTQAARLLGESRPTLMKRLRAGELTSTMVGTHHRLDTAEVLRLRQSIRDQRRADAEAFLDLEDDLGL